MAKPLRMALGSLIIQTRYQYSDRELIEQLSENPYYQYFIGLAGYQEEPPFVASLLVFFRKRISADLLLEANEYMLEAVSEMQPENKGTLMLDATCAPSNIRYPQDFSLLNEARENYLCLAKNKKRSIKKSERRSRNNYLMCGVTLAMSMDILRRGMIFSTERNDWLWS